MKGKLILMLLLAAALAAGFAWLRPRKPAGKLEAPQSASIAPADAAQGQPAAADFTRGSDPAARRSQRGEAAPALQAEEPATNKLQRLAQLREQFRSLAAGNAKAAMVAAKQLTNQVERETALLALVTEWTQGDLSSPLDRASAIATYGLEAGLGMELAKNPELALSWANELTEGRGRVALLQQTAIELAATDPQAAFALGEQLDVKDRAEFSSAIFAGWASTDTDAALWWAGQLPTESERDAALRAIRSAAPVGIGAELSIREGYPVINGLLPGTPAEASGQLHSGDRIVALAQGDNAFIDTRNMSMQDVVQRIRGAPGTLLQLQVLSADAPAGSPPQTISIIRDQIRFKR